MASKKTKVKKAVKTAKKHPKLVIAVAIILVIIIAVTVVLWFVKPQIFHKLLGTGEHYFDEWIVSEEPTCVDSGSRYHICTVCGEEEEEPVSANGHDWGEWQTVTEATCGKDGTKERTCSICKETDGSAIPASGKHDWGEWQTVTEATCGKDGTKERTCTVCKETDGSAIPATGLHNYNGDGVCTDCGSSSSGLMSGSADEVPTAELSIHFLELGNKYSGDCTLIKCGDTEVLIDAGSRQDSAATIKAYVDAYCTDGVLEYVIATHAHQDHIAGFVGNGSGNNKTGILYQYKIGTLIQFAGHNTTSNIYKNYCQAVEYAQSKGTTVYTAKQCWYQTDGAQKQYFLDDKQSISMNILYNYYYDNKTSDENDYSVCMLLTEHTGNSSRNYLFTGDLEEKGESYLVDNNTLPEVELFKGGHHGSYTASTEKLLSVIKPKNIAVCCCCGSPEYTQNPDNTFPSQAFINRASKYTENIYCTTLATEVPDIVDGKIGSKSWQFTSMNGNIVFYSSNGSLKLYCTNNDTILKDTEWFKANRKWNA